MHNQTLQPLPIKSEEKVLQEVSNKDRLLLDPEGYARGAIATIEDQLKGVKSPRRKLRLESKLAEWKTFLSVASQPE